MCLKCKNEYNDPNNRLFHYELISCKYCGPKFSIIEKNGATITSKDPILYSAKLIDEGNIIAAKGIGGFHIITSATNSNPIIKVRDKKNRKNKPFAIMSKDLESTRSFAILNQMEEKILSSLTRPIVILEKSKNYFLSSSISPTLNTIGVMLPYSGFHLSLLNHVRDPVLVMTSGNNKDNPIIKNEKEAVKSLGDCVDYFLVHDREIFTQCDDSIFKIIENNPILLRGSRGLSPLKITFPKKSSECILALGCEQNVTFSIVSNSDCFLSQYIGNLYNPESYRHFRNMIYKMMKFQNIKPSIFACDLHPTIMSTKLAYQLSKDNSSVFQIQHHHAHMASLMAEYNLDNMIGIICDGIGYGLDGNLWGGEIFRCENVTKFERIGHLSEQPMIGGDLATINPLRMVAGILLGQVDGIENFLYSNLVYFPYFKKELESIITISKSRSYAKTTSTGRVLDAISSLLGICYQRTFEGEPAISLESSSLEGKDILIPPKISNNILDTTNLLKFIFENKSKFSLRDLAYSAQTYIAKGLANIAIESALSSDIRVIGFSGGVAYNKVITKIIRKEVERSGVKFIIHKNIPPGDGGISVGQAYYTMTKILEK
jgi:hydrogenase maturation protein HypF